MEEILASIRRIISEDDAGAEPMPAAVPSPEPALRPVPDPEPVFAEPEPAPIAEVPAEEEEVLELTERYEPEPPVETIGDLDVAPVDPAPAARAPVTALAMSGEPLVDDGTAATAASAFAGFAASLRRPEPAADLPVGAGTSLEALVGSLLRPMLKDWLDANLPGIVEEQVRKEVERIARSAG